MVARLGKLLLAPILAGAFLAGCTTTIIPPPDPPDPLSVLVIDYGRHSSLVLFDKTAQSWVEYTYGDWAWFAEARTAWYNVFATLFWPTPGALGQRQQQVPDLQKIRPIGPCEHVLKVTVSQEKADALAAALRALFAQCRDSLHYQPLHDLHFAHSEKAFHLFHNCNHVVAHWLVDLGCDVRGPAMTADFVLPK